MNSGKKNLKVILSIAVVSLMVTAAIAIFWWIHTPYFAIQQIGTSIANKDSKTFYEFCDANGLVMSLTDQLFFQPAIHTHGMSEFQNYVAAGAILMTKNRVDGALIAGINRMVTPVPNTSFYHVFPQSIYQNYTAQNVYWDPYDSSSQQGKIVLIGRTLSGEELAGEKPAKKLDLGDFAKSVGRELKTEQQDLKRLAAQRMQEYATNHQDQLFGRLLAGAMQGANMKEMLGEYGFQSKNVRTMYFQKDEDREICTVEFFSPKVNANVPVSVELVPVSPAEVLSKWRVVRMWRLKETMMKLGEDTDSQVHDLVRYSLQDIAPEQAANRTKNLLQRITKTEGAQKLLQQLKGRL